MSLTDDQYWERAVVGAVDLLGINAMVAHDDMCEDAMCAIAFLTKNTLEPLMYSVPDFATRQPMFRDSIYFGDSVYLFGDPNQSLEKQTNLLVTKIGALLWWACERGFLLRGSVAAGDLRIRTVKTVSANKEVRIGSAMTRAHELEELQCWSGAAVAPDVPVTPNDSLWIVDYHVPLKSASSKFDNSNAINWVGQGQNQSTVVDRIRSASTAIGDSPLGREKMNNTIKFVDHVFEIGRFAPVTYEVRSSDG